MAQYTVTYACGHTGTLELFGKGKDREWKLQKAAEGDCPQCWGAKKRAIEEATPLTL